MEYTALGYLVFFQQLNGKEKWVQLSVFSKFSKAQYESCVARGWAEKRETDLSDVKTASWYTRFVAYLLRKFYVRGNIATEYRVTEAGLEFWGDKPTVLDRLKGK